VYPDTPVALRRWTEAGIKLCIYSSGSIEAQKLIFGHSEAGDLTRYLSGYFDTTTGPKREAESYSKIAAALMLTPADILFISDVAAETDAAKAAGLRALLIDRDTGQGDIASFAEVLP
jgi:enolase-phosphatase E1